MTHSEFPDAFWSCGLFRELGSPPPALHVTKDNE